MVDARHPFAFPRFGRAALAGAILLAAPALADNRETRLEELRARIERLQHDLNATIGKRDSAREELQAVEQQIAQRLDSLQRLDAQLAEKTRYLRTLERREEGERRAQRKHLAALEAQIRASFALGRQPHLKLLLNQESPATAARVVTYYRYFNEARTTRLREAQARLARLQDFQQQIRDQTHALAQLREAHERERQALEETRTRRAQLLAALNQRLVGQQEEIERLRADETRLQRLVRELRAMLPPADAPGTRERFAALKGRLPLPLAGRIVARYGESKGIGDLTWRGVFLAAKEGQNVYAVARGRVAFAEWLRGFGLLLILDHGDGYMTLYGHNQVLYRRAGDWVEAGEAIAVAGNTGDAPAMGVYFEIRHNGIPHDPLQWCARGQTVPPRARR